MKSWIVNWTDKKYQKSNVTFKGGVENKINDCLGLKFVYKTVTYVYINVWTKICIDK